MIARLWRGRATRPGAETYRCHVVETVFPALKQIPGHMGAFLLSRQVGEQVAVRQRGVRLARAVDHALRLLPVRHEPVVERLRGGYRKHVGQLVQPLRPGQRYKLISE